MAGRYANRTEVGAEATRADVERTLRRYGADQFAVGYDLQQGLLGFRLRGRTYRLTVPLPRHEDFQYTAVREFERTKKQWDDAYEQATRQRCWS